MFHFLHGINLVHNTLVLVLVVIIFDLLNNIELIVHFRFHKTCFPEVPRTNSFNLSIDVMMTLILFILTNHQLKNSGSY